MAHLVNMCVHLHEHMLTFANRERDTSTLFRDV